MKLEQEAEEFVKSRQKKTSVSKPKDRTGFRYYMGAALSGLLTNGGYHTRPEDVLEQAAKYAELALQKEQEVLGP